MRNIITIENIVSLGKNLKEIAEELERLSENNDVYIKEFDFNITDKNRKKIFETLSFAVGINKLKLSEIRKETAKTRKKGDVGKKKSLNEEQELELIATIVENGYTRQEASNKYNVSPATVSRILKKHNISLKPGRR